MAQDFARRQRAKPRKEKSLPGWAWFLTGITVGVFASFLVYVWHDIPADPEATAILEKPVPENVETDEMQWDFYNIFPKSEVPIIEEYQKDGTKTVVASPTAWLLQAGSFRDPADADRLRAELILQGMNVFTREVESNGQSWHRVLVGPIPSELETDRLRRRLAEANIASITLKVTP